MVTCAVNDCRNNNVNTRRKIRFFRFPSEPRRRKLWTEFCDRQRPWSPNTNSRICSDHFDEYQYEVHRQDGRKKLSPVAIPTVYSRQIELCGHAVDGNVKDIIKEEKNVFGMALNVVSCDEFMYHQCIVWLDHDYCKVWNDGVETAIKNDAIFLKSEPAELQSELEIKREDLSDLQQSIETLETVIKQEPQFAV